MYTKERTDTPTRWPLDVHDGETGATVQRVLIALLALGVLNVLALIVCAFIIDDARDELHGIARSIARTPETVR